MWGLLLVGMREVLELGVGVGGELGEGREGVSGLVGSRVRGGNVGDGETDEVSRLCLCAFSPMAMAANIKARLRRLGFWIYCRPPALR